MPDHLEPLDGGLVTIRDPSLLKPGELASCTNAMYRPGSLSLRRAPGHSLFGTVSASATIQGLVAMKFDNGNHYLFAETADGTSFRAPVGDTGSWTQAETGLTSGTWLEGLQYSNRYFLLNGANPNRVAYLSATAVANNPTFRTMGMQPVTVTPACITAAGTWSQTVTGYFEYWTTEAVPITQDGATAWLEGTFGNDPYNPSLNEINPKTIQVTSTSQSVTIFRPFPSATSTGSAASAFDAKATHWRVYRSAKKDVQTDTLFPTGFAITDYLPISTLSFTDGSSASASAFAASASAVTVASWSGSGIALVSSVSASDNKYAELQAPAGGTIAGMLKTYGYVFNTTPTDPIAGFEVVVEAKANAATRSLTCGLTNDGGSTASPFKSVPLNSSDTSYTIGSPNNLWGLTWNSATVTATSLFGVLFSGTIHNSTPGTVIDIDQVKVNVYFNGTPASTNDPFANVIINVGGQESAIGSHGPPPKASTGDVFEDCLVLNDTAFPSFVRWSLAGAPEYFPWIYFYDFETDDNDQVTCIKTLGNRLVVGLRNSLWRMNYLPTEEDASFNRGKAVDLISSSKGIVNPKAACTYTSPDGRTELAFVTTSGPYTTDGFQIRELAPDINWASVFSGLSMFNGGIVELENDPYQWELKLFVTGTSGTQLYRLHYHPVHIKERGLKVSGPTLLTHGSSTNVRAACVVPRSDGTYSTFLGYAGTGTGGGAVYRETGTNIPVTNTGPYNAAISTRNLYLANPGNEWRLTDLYLHHAVPNATTTLQVSTTLSHTDTADALAGAAQTIVTSNSGLSKLSINQLGEGITVGIADDSGSTSVIKDWELNYLLLRGEGFGSQS